MSSQLTATVVVARTARENSHAEAEAWLQKLIGQARKAPGFVRSELQRPTPQRSDDWVVVYEFADHDTLADWLASPERRENCQDEADIFEGPSREQVLATPGKSTAVTGVSSFMLRRPDDPREAQQIEDEFMNRFRGLVDAVKQYDGFLSCDLLEAKEGIQEEVVVVFSFDSRENLDAWFYSDQRTELLEGIDPLLAETRTTNVVGGFAGWFAPGRQVPTWKQASLVLLALYPTSLTAGYLRDLVAPDLPFAAATFIGNALGVAVLSWFLMPPLTRYFEHWLGK